MGTGKQEDLIARQDGNKVIRAECGEPGETKALTRATLMKSVL